MTPDGSPPTASPPPTAPPAVPAPARRPTLFDKIARTVALLALVIIFTVIYWIPLVLIGSPFAAPFVLAVLTLAGVNMASRLHRLRQRVDELEERLAAAPQK